MNFLNSVKFFLPELFLLTGALIALLTHFLVQNKKAVGMFSLAVLLGTLFLCRAPQGPHLLFFGFYNLDLLTHFFRALVLASAAAAVWGAIHYARFDRRTEGPFYCLLLVLAFALILTAGTTNLLALFISVEFVCLISYLMTAFLYKDRRAQEAAVKYFLFGAFATGIMLYGISLVFGAAGSLEAAVILKSTVAVKFAPIMTFGLLLFLAGLGFKISMVPFHFAAPDSHEAAPTPLTALLAAAPKAVGFAVLLRVLLVPFLSVSHKWQILMLCFAILTMSIGNLLAVAQVNIKRLLAYSCIAQTGYILVGFAAPSNTGMNSILINLAAYTLTNLGAFLTVIAVSNSLGDDSIQSYAGLSKKSPFLAFSLTIFLLSLTGLPPTAGFVAKWFTLSTSIETGLNILTAATLLNSVLAAFYYFRIIKLMYLMPAIDEEPVPPSFPLYIIIAFLFIAVVAAGLYPSALIDSVKGIFPG